MAQPREIPAPEPRRVRPSYPWFIAGVGSWFAAMGMQSVLFAWLVVGVLGLDGKWVGVAQSAHMVPSMLLILLGGAVADRRDRRDLLVGLHALAGATAAALAALVWAGWLTFPLLLAYALCLGSIQAFVLPARDSLLSEVTRVDMLRAVTGLNLAQWGFQALGAYAAGLAAWIGIAPALSLVAMVLLVGVGMFGRLAPAPPHQRPTQGLRAADLWVGMRIVLASPSLAPVFTLTLAVGVLFGGPFMVVFPLLVRDYYAGDVWQLAYMSTAFPVGTLAGGLALLLRGGLRRKGAAQLAAVAAGSLCLGVVAVGLPFWAALIAVGGWGVCGSVFMNAGRTVFQEQAPIEQRARVLAAYSLGFMGASGLLGAPLSGLLADAIGPLATLALASGCMLATVGVLLIVTDLAHQR